MFKHILVALDGSATSNAGFTAALQLASDQHASIVGVHAIDSRVLTVGFDGGYVPSTYIDKLQDSLRENGRAILRKAEDAARATGVEMKAVLVETHGHTVADAILAQVRKTKADLIVLGTHGRRGLSRVLMGSDAEAVVRAAPVPVLLVRMPERAARRRPASAKKPGAARRTTTRRTVTSATTK